MVLFINSVCYGQDPSPIVGNWFYIHEDTLGDSHLTAEYNLIFKNDGTFSCIINSVMKGGAYDGQTGSMELISGKYTLSSNKLTLYIGMYEPDTCSVIIKGNTMTLSGFSNVNNQVWFENEYQKK
jgi:hypothetical protein